EGPTPPPNQRDRLRAYREIRPSGTVLAITTAIADPEQRQHRQGEHDTREPDIQKVSARGDRGRIGNRLQPVSAPSGRPHDASPCRSMPVAKAIDRNPDVR